MVCLILVLCYAMTTCFELYIKTCYHITFSASQAFAWWSWGYGCYWFLFHECLLFTSHHTGQTPLEVFQGVSQMEPSSENMATFWRELCYHLVRRAWSVCPPDTHPGYWFYSQLSRMCISVKNGEMINNYVLLGSTPSTMFNSTW